MNPSPIRTAPLNRRAGLSLLEVLVACGILVIGLSSIAAILPAASSRLAQAAQEDRAGIAAANAYAEAVNRGLLSSKIFTDTSKPAVFGKVLPNLAGSLVASGSTAGLIDPTRGFVLEDELIYQPPTTTNTPVNSFFGGLTGPREYKEAVCWGAMLAPTTYPAAAGNPAALSIAVFRKEGTVSPELALTQASGIHKMASPDEAVMKKFLKGCSYVLALPSSANVPPRFFQITSSWMANSECWVVFTDPDGLNSFCGASPNVIGFENLMRVDDYQITLD
jgi:hypothetical protein